MEDDVMKELRLIKDEIAAPFRSFREFFDALMRQQARNHPEFSSAQTGG